MEGKGLKSVIMCVLVLGLVVEQIQVEGGACCPCSGVKCYIEGAECPPGLPRKVCAKRCGCKFVDYEQPCPPGYDNCPLPSDKLNLFPKSEEAIVSDYCKLGCGSSLCAINTDVGSDDVEHCKNACSRFCSKGVEIAKATA